LLYHVIARGNNQEATFADRNDYHEYVSRLIRYRSRYRVTVHAYCLMPNHVHLLLQTSEPPLPKLMQVLQQSYTQWFNRVHGRVGHLFQGRYKAIVCDTDAYFTALVRYIHLNPVRAGLAADPGEYAYSSHREYATATGPGTTVVDPARALAILGGRQAYQRFMLAGHGAGAALGPWSWGESPGAHDDGQPHGPTASRTRQTVPEGLSDIAARLGVTLGQLWARRQSAPVARARAVAAYVVVHRRGHAVSEVAAALKRDRATISIMTRRVARRASSEPRVAAALEAATGPDPYGNEATHGA
jgi:REP element-mobilizing transposase RayT